MIYFQRDKELAKKFQLLPPTGYNYLNQSGCIRLEGINDADKFDSLRLAFEIVQIAPEMIEGILSVLSSILWLGNLTFEVKNSTFNIKHAQNIPVLNFTKVKNIWHD